MVGLQALGKTAARNPVKQTAKPATTVYDGSCPACGGSFVDRGTSGVAVCSFPKCKKVMPENDDRPADGWAYAIITRYYQNRIKKERIWTCPSHSIASVERQAGLLGPG